MPFRLKRFMEKVELSIWNRRMNGVNHATSPKPDGGSARTTLLTEIRQCERHLSHSPAFTDEPDSPSLERSFDFSYSAGPPSSQISVAGSEQEEIDLRSEELRPLPVLVTVKTQEPLHPRAQQVSFTTLRVTYLLVTLVVMLADGLQGTHLYVLYESYGYSVASLYCLGFLTGGVMSPVTGPMVDRIGRKKAAILYCLLEMFINGLEQYPYLPGLVASRMIGGFTTNLLCQVFETWLDTEYRLRGLDKDKYEIIMRDSVIVSNAAAIFSGYLAHVLAEWYGAKGPFRGAVCCTGFALAVVATLWTENYGSSQESDTNTKDMVAYFREAVNAFRADSRMLRVGAAQGLTAGSIQIFIFLWAPTLRALAQAAKAFTLGMDSQGEPAYGLIFGAFMAAGVIGGILAPAIRKAFTCLLSPPSESEDDDLEIVEVDGEEMEVRPMAVEFLAALCYILSALLLLAPYVINDATANSFTMCLVAFLVFELLIGVLLPCEGVIRSLYFPATARASVMSLPRIVVNGAVSVGVASTNYIRLETAFAAVAAMMMVSAVLQLSLISSREWSSLGSRLARASQHVASLPSLLPVLPTRSTKIKQG